MEKANENKEVMVTDGKIKVTPSMIKKPVAGDKIRIADIMWTILDITEKGYMCLAEKLEDSMQFGSNNDWKVSSIRKYLNGEFLEKLVSDVGAENVIEFERDLLSLDGQMEYGSCMDKVSLLTFDEYRKNRKHIPNAGYWWWLLTPDSTPCNDDDTWVRVVSPQGNFNCGSFNNCNGVRPVCIFSSAIFESEE